METSTTDRAKLNQSARLMWQPVLKGLFALILYLLTAGYGYADFSALGVSPTRVLIAETARSGAITLHNSSSSEITYRLRLLEMGLDAGGQFRELNTSELPAGHNSSARIIRFSPRQVKLAPGESQVIRAIVRRSPNLESGEYRSHLNIQALPALDKAALANSVTGNGDTALLLAKSPTTVGITIPVIVRHKNTSASVTIKKVHFPVSSDGVIRQARVLVGRSGNRSAYGEIQLYSSAKPENALLGSIRGYAIYHPYNEEWVNILLSRPIEAGSTELRSYVHARFIDNEHSSRSGNVLFDNVVPAVTGQ